MKALIMAGGRGTRFWPASRKGRPKQFLNIAGRRTLFQETIARLHPLFKIPDLHVVCGPKYAEDIFSQAPRLKRDQVVVEPLARGTAACIGLAAMRLRRSDPEEVMVVLPADHVIAEVEEFHQLLRAGEKLAEDGWLVTFGIRPTYPATGFGYLEKGRSLGKFGEREAFRVVRFREKPDLVSARNLVRSGRHDWNSGIFVWKIDAVLRAIQELMPDLYRALEAVESQPDDEEFQREVFSTLESISVDVGVMEKAARVATIPCDLHWSDVGNWSALQQILDKDDQGNVSNCRYVSVDSQGCVLHGTQGKLVGLVGVKNLVLVETQDAILVCDRDRTEDVKDLVKELEKLGLEKFL